MVSEMMTTKEEEILDVNSRFYESIRNSEIDAMEEVWLTEEKAKCVHPGWPMLYGWQEIKTSWVSIFENSAPLEIELSDVRVRIVGDLAWVICIERISHKLGEEIRLGFAESTNIFEYGDSGWLLVLHHASPVPVPRGEVESSEDLQ